MTAACDHAAAAQVHNGAGEPVRLICPCGREWRCLPAEWAVQVTTVASLTRSDLNTQGTA